MLLFLKTVRSVCKFCQQLALECTKLMKVRFFLEHDPSDSYPVHFGIMEGWLPLYAKLPSLYIVRGFALLALAHEMFNCIIIV